MSEAKGKRVYCPLKKSQRSFSIIQSMCRHPSGPIFITHMRLGTERTDMLLMLLPVEGVITSSVSDQGVSCLLMSHATIYEIAAG